MHSHGEAHGEAMNALERIDRLTLPPAESEPRRVAYCVCKEQPGRCLITAHRAASPPEEHP